MLLTWSTNMFLNLWLLCSVAMLLGSAEPAVDHLDLANTIRMYSNYSESDFYVYMECMPDKTTYQMKPHQQVTIDFIIPTTTVTLLVYTCVWGGVTLHLNTTIEIISDKWHIEIATIPDIGKTSGMLQCFMYDVTRFSLVTTICEVHISIGEEVNEYIPHQRSYGVIHLLMQSDNRSMETPEIYLADNTNLTLLCQFNNKFKSPIHNYTMHRIYANGSEVDVLSNILEENIYDAIDIVVYFQKETYNDNTIVCLQKNTENNEVIRTELRLKYRSERRETVNSKSILLPVILTMCLPLIFMITVTASYYYWRYRGNKTAAKASRGNRSDSHVYEDIPLAVLGEEGAGVAGAAPSGADCGEPRAGTPDSNDYEELYDVMYEDRLRIERLQKKLQQGTNIPEPPPPPPLETIPHRACNEATPISRPRRPTPPPSGSLIPASDLYLLKLDSEGYEIPDELRFIQLPIQSSDGVM